MELSELVPTYRTRLEALPEGATPDRWWDVLAELAAVPVTGIDAERDADQLLFEAGAEASGYHVYITREVLPEGGGAIYVTCAFTFPPSRTRTAMVQIWGSPAAAAEWITKVRASPAFAVLAQPALTTEIDAAGVRS